MDPTPSPLDTLRQLKELLDAGTLTPAEFEALKRKLVFGEAAPAEAVASAGVPAALEPVVAELVFAPPVVALPPGRSEPRAVEADQPDDLPTPRNYLNLVLALGGLLALLALVLYLNLNPHPSEHIGSTSLTAADTVQTVEIGPTVPQPVARPVVPETVRVVPRLPVVPPVPATVPDSVDAPVVLSDE